RRRGARAPGADRVRRADPIRPLGQCAGGVCAIRRGLARDILQQGDGWRGLRWRGLRWNVKGRTACGSARITAAAPGSRRSMNGRAILPTLTLALLAITAPAPAQRTG